MFFTPEPEIVLGKLRKPFVDSAGETGREQPFEGRNCAGDGCRRDVLSELGNERISDAVWRGCEGEQEGASEGGCEGKFGGHYGDDVVSVLLWNGGRERERGEER